MDTLELEDSQDKMKLWKTKEDQVKENTQLKTKPDSQEDRKQCVGSNIWLK